MIFLEKYYPVILALKYTLPKLKQEVDEVED